MEPRVLRRERKHHLSYEVAHRIHCSSIYPLAAPNGSAVILFGHDSGLRLLWRGGRRLQEHSSTRLPARANGTSKSQDVMNIDNDEDVSAAEEDEQDPDCPFPRTIQDVNIDLDSGVLCMATPSRPPSSTPSSSKRQIFVAVACSSGRISLLRMPLAPPKNAGKTDFVERDLEQLELEAGGSIASDLAVKFLPADEEPAQTHRPQSDSNSHPDGQFLLASAADVINIWRIALRSDSIISSGTNRSPCIRLPLPGLGVCFHPSSRSADVLIAEHSGAVRIYEVFAPGKSGQGPSSRDSTSRGPRGADAGRWVMSYLSPLHWSDDDPPLARRKKMLSAEWILGGRGILVLLQDGEWGIWDLSGSATGDKPAHSFSVRGDLGTSSSADIVDTSKQRKTASKLAPMTPNTRRAKAENLFSGTPKVPATSSTGGIAVSQISSRSGQTDESVVLWYNGAVYSIPSMQSFWQRTANPSGGLGSLYAPALARISEVDLINEHITSVSQFAPTSKSSGLGEMNMAGDLVISAEHRFIILQSFQPPILTTKLNHLQGAERSHVRDQRMLDAGELDLGGMDRLLGSMAGGPKPRRVDFAS